VGLYQQPSPRTYRIGHGVSRPEAPTRRRGRSTRADELPEARELELGDDPELDEDELDDEERDDEEEDGEDEPPIAPCAP
jgi:hypothetical protein